VIVVDASAVVELLLQTDVGVVVEELVYEKDVPLHAPHLLDIEVLSALRRLVLTGEVPLTRAAEALQDLSLVHIVRHGHVDLTARAWGLRGNFTAYDAIYLALAEALDATLVTCDKSFGRSVRGLVPVEIVS
jgi:predicted nucleic acid-binding protein